MKKILLLSLFSLLIGGISLKAQQPEEIYIGTWETMQELGQPITPNADDPVLTYNSETQCYEGEVIDWPRITVNPYNAKIPYSMEGDVITYYGVAGSTVQFSFNSEDSYTFEFTADTDPAEFKGFGLAITSDYSVADVKVSMNLESNEITFTRFESGAGAEIPVLVSIDPENGEEITPDEDGFTVTLTFSGEVTTLEAINDGVLLPVEPSENGEVWTITVPTERIELISESQGLITLQIQKVYSNGLPLSFENGSPVLYLTYPIAGVTHTATLSFIGVEEAMETLNVYKYPEYSVGDQVDFEGDSFSFIYTDKATYLFTAGVNYEVFISSDIESNDGENWELGEGYSTKKGPNGETTNEVAAEGVTLTIYAGASGAEFTITVAPKEAGVDSITDNERVLKIYDINGSEIRTTGEGNQGNLRPGIYIINGKKTMVK